MAVSVRSMFAVAAIAGTLLSVAGAPSSAAERDPLTVSIANVASRPTPPVGQILDAQNPHILVISEAYHARAHLADVAERKGYKLRQYGLGEGEEGPDVALLIRDDVTIEDLSLLKMCRNHFPGFLVGGEGPADHALVKRDRGARIDDVRRHDAPEGMHGWFTFKLSAAPL